MNLSDNEKYFLKTEIFAEMQNYENKSYGVYIVHVKQCSEFLYKVISDTYFEKSDFSILSFFANKMKERTISYAKELLLAVDIFITDFSKYHSLYNRHQDIKLAFAVYTYLINQIEKISKEK